MGADDDPDLIRVESELGSIDELVARAAPLVDGDLVALGAATTAAPGERRRFQLLLADGTVALDGVGDVVVARPGGPPGARLRIVELDDVSRAVHARILAARFPIPRPGAGKAAPPPWRRPAVASTPDASRAGGALAPSREPTPPPALAPEAVLAPEAAPVPSPAPERAEPEAVLASASAPEPVPALEPERAEPAPEPEPERAPRLAPAWTPPPWLRSRRVQIVLAVTALIFLIGIVAALTTDDAEPRSSGTRTTVARATPPDAGVGTPAPAAEAMDLDAGAEPDAAPPDGEVAPAAAPRHDAPASKPHRDPPKRTSSRPSSRPSSTPKKKTSGRSVRLSVRSDPAGATILVDGDDASRGPIMVPSGSTVKVTVTKRGYKRVTRSVAVGNGTSLVIKLQKL